MFIFSFFFFCNTSYLYLQCLQIDLNGDLNYNNPPEIELSCNASAFAVFASVRSAILERHTKTNEVCSVSNYNRPPSPEYCETTDTESDDEERISTLQSLPKVTIRVIDYVHWKNYIRVQICLDCRYWFTKCFYIDERK